VGCDAALKVGIFLHARSDIRGAARLAGLTISDQPDSRAA